MTDESGRRKFDLTRSDVLKVMGVGVGVLAMYRNLPWISRVLGDVGRSITNGLEEKDLDLDKIDWRNFDFVSQPELLKVKGLREKMIGQLVGWKGRAKEIWKYEADLYKNDQELVVDDALWEQNASLLVDETYKQAQLLEDSINNGLFDVEEEQSRKYYEYSTWLRYVLLGTKHLADLPLKESYEELVSLTEQNVPMLAIGSDQFDKPMPDGFKRLQIHALWNYPWQVMAGGGTTGMHPIWKVVVSGNGDEFVFGPNSTTNLLLQESKRDVEEDIFSLEGRPKEMRIFNLDADVARVVEGKFRRLGLDRGVTSFRWMNIDSFPQGVTSPDGNVNIGGGIKILDLKSYLSHATLFDQIGYHEANHALIGRSFMLEGIDRLRYRDHMIRVFRRFDPLRSMKSIFTPKGEYPEPTEYENEFDFSEAVARNTCELVYTDYYMEILLGAVYGETVKTNMDELRNGIMLMGGKDLYSGLWPVNVTTLEEYFDTLSKNDQLHGVSKLVADTMLANKDVITNMKRWTFNNMPELYKVTEVVLPLVIAHLAKYKTKDLEDALLTEDVNKDVAHSFFINWQTRLNDMIMNQPCEDLLGEIFGFMMTYSKPDAKKRWSETFSDFKQMLLLLKRNQLAYKSQTTV